MALDDGPCRKEGKMLTLDEAVLLGVIMRS